jgi:hypothetical protein
MKKALLLLIFLFAVHTHTQAQGVGAGGFDPYLQSVIDYCDDGTGGKPALRVLVENCEPIQVETQDLFAELLTSCPTITYETDTIFMEPNTVYDLSWADTKFTNVFATYPMGGGNAVSIDGNYYNVPADTAGNTYFIGWDIFINPRRIEELCRQDSVVVSWQIVFENNPPKPYDFIYSNLLSGDFSQNFGTANLVGNILSGTNLVSTSDLLVPDSLFITLYWSSDAALSIDGAILTLIDLCPVERPKTGLKVFIENCEPLQVEIVNNNVLQVEVVDNCIVGGRVQIQTCAEKDTITFLGNTIHSIELYPDTLNRAYYLQALSPTFVPTNREVKIKAPDCTLIQNDIVLFCNETSTLIVTID